MAKNRTDNTMIGLILIRQGILVPKPTYVNAGTNHETAIKSNELKSCNVSMSVGKHRTYHRRPFAKAS